MEWITEFITEHRNLLIGLGLAFTIAVFMWRKQEDADTFLSWAKRFSKNTKTNWGSYECQDDLESCLRSTILEHLKAQYQKENHFIPIIPDEDKERVCKKVAEYFILNNRVTLNA